ncbi:MAG TPA: hypothetical protein VK945_13310 [Planococcus sp. (in: firmicutes)]|nr:hypothetical protein [Planococcus sp. (in: firmicutes)]
MGGIYLFTLFFPVPNATVWISLFALIALVSYYRYLGRVPKTLITVLIAVALLLDLSVPGLQQFFLGLQTNVNILAIFIFVPLLSIPIQQGNYLTYIETIFSAYVQRTQRLFLFTTLSAGSIGAVMNIGTLPILYDLTNTESFRPYSMVRIKALSRGFVLAFMWSPYFISIGLVLAYFDVRWLQIFPIGISIALLVMFIGYLSAGKEDEQIPRTADAPAPDELRLAKRKVLELVAIITFITALIMAVENFTELSVLAIIPLTAIAVSICWTVLISTPSEFIGQFRSYLTDKVPSMGNELSIFIVAGAFGTALLNNGAGEAVNFLLEALNITHVLLLIPAMMVLMVVTAVLGVHPVITAAILSITLSNSPAFLDDHLFLSFGLLAAWMAAILVSPFSGLNLLLAAISGRSSFQIAFRANPGFALMLWSICYTVLAVLYFLL